MDRAGHLRGSRGLVRRKCHEPVSPSRERSRSKAGPSDWAGSDQVLAHGREALAAGEFTWAAELSDYVLGNDGENATAKRIKAQALIELGERQINAIARNYYLSSAGDLLKDVPRQ